MQTIYLTNRNMSVGRHESREFLYIYEENDIKKKKKEEKNEKMDIVY